MSGPALKADAELAEVMKSEAAWITARRALMGDDRPAGSGPRVGLALSGGGIRSATFSLGVLQAMSRHGCLGAVDYLSTVSGGSYIGSFFGALFVPPEDRFGTTPLTPEELAGFTADPLNCERGHTAIMRLREFGRYLTPGGLSDTLFGASLMARNWLAVQLVLGMVPLILFYGLRLLPQLGPLRLPNAPDDTLQLGSPLLLEAALVAALAAAGLAAGYWFSPREDVAPSRWRRMANVPLLATLVAALIGAFLLLRDAGWRLPPPSIPAAVLTIAVAAILSYALALRFYGQSHLPASPSAVEVRAAAAQAEDTVRARMTRGLATANKVCGLFLLWFVIESLGRSVDRSIAEAAQNMADVQARATNDTFWASSKVFVAHFWPMLIVVAPLALTIWAHRGLRHGTGPGWLARPSGQTFLGFSILFLWMVVWATIASDLAMRAGTTGWTGWIVLGAMILIAGLQCFLYGFLNLSSLVTLYAARLKRAYVGASNPSPQRGGYDVDRPGDLVPMRTYYGPRPVNGASSLVHARPVHLINVTIAQTEPEGDSHVVAYDRKGKPMHVSPAGIVYERGAAGRVGVRPFGEAEELSLSSWTAISGAAASTAIGSVTSLGLSVLAMMANVRLGYWWKMDTSALAGKWLRSPFDTVPGYLFSELASRFDTTPKKRRRWYLTDGGHFENTGAYALLQRALEFIVICDNGADPDYRFDDVVRLIDRARTDLGAEIAFLDRGALDRHLGWWGSIRHAFGTYEELASPPLPEARSGPYATLARIRYTRAAPVGGKVPEGLLMLIKPRLNFSEPPELLAYRRREAGRSFPQQTTLDQSFDEEQWEAYRRFGEVVGERLFAPATEAGFWSPRGQLRGGAHG